MNLLNTMDSLLSNTIYFDMHIQLLVTNGELLIIRAVIKSEECTQLSGHANVSKYLLIFQPRTGNETTVSVYMHLLKGRTEWLNSPI